VQEWYKPSILAYGWHGGSTVLVGPLILAYGWNDGRLQEWHMSIHFWRICVYITSSMTRNLIFIYNFSSPSRAQSLSGSSPAGLVTKFYSLRFETLPGSLIYIPEEQGGPVIPPCTGFPLSRLLRPAWPRRGSRRKHLFHYCVFCNCRGKFVSTELLRSNSSCTVTCLHSCRFSNGSTCYNMYLFVELS
jgi:hypothetical protein